MTKKTYNQMEKTIYSEYIYSYKFYNGIEVHFNENLKKEIDEKFNEYLKKQSELETVFLDKNNKEIKREPNKLIINRKTLSDHYETVMIDYFNPVKLKKS